jgi:hypothetical protein
VRSGPIGTKGMLLLFDGDAKGEARVSDNRGMLHLRFHSILVICHPSPPLSHSPFLQTDSPGDDGGGPGGGTFPGQS